MENRRLATIQVNEAASGHDKIIVWDDVNFVFGTPGGGATVVFRDGRTPWVLSESVSDVQTAVNALWDESHT